MKEKSLINKGTLPMVKRKKKKKLNQNFLQQFSFILFVQVSPIAVKTRFPEKLIS